MGNPGTRGFKEGLATTQNKLLYHLLMFASQKIVLESQKLDFLDILHSNSDSQMV